MTKKLLRFRCLTDEMAETIDVVKTKQIILSINSQPIKKNHNLVINEMDI